MKWIIVSIAGLALAVGVDPNIQEEFYDVNTSPVVWDMNQVTGKPLGTVVHRIGAGPLVFRGKTWDRDGHDVDVSLIKAPSGMEISLAREPNYPWIYTVSWEPNEADIGSHYVWIRVIDNPPIGEGPPEPNSGTVLADIRRPNSAPSLGCRIFR